MNSLILKSEVLQKSWELINQPGGWTKGVFSRDLHGNRTIFGVSEGVSFCSVGALYHTQKTNKVSLAYIQDLVCKLNKAVRIIHGEGYSIVKVNDTVAQKVSDLKPVWELAIALALADEKIESSSIQKEILK
jgi:hypothetical protein